MRLSVIAVGRLKAGPEKDLAEDYRKRSEALGRRAGITRLAVTEFSESFAREAKRPDASIRPAPHRVIAA